MNIIISLFRFSLNFPNGKLKLFPSFLDSCLQEHCEGQIWFYVQMGEAHDLSHT